MLLSTTSVYPEPTPVAFELARRLGYDGVELMVFTDPVSQDAAVIKRLSDHYGVPVGAVHAPCLLMTQRVWSPDPWHRLRRSVEMADHLHAPMVVVHPPFTWQKEYARRFPIVLDELESLFPHITVAVENMYPVKMGKRKLRPYTPHWDPTRRGHNAYTLDFSHCAASGADAMEMAQRMGEKLRHIHLTDGTKPGLDEHLIPGRGNQPCARLLRQLALQGWDGAITVEVSTRKSGSRLQREADLAESLEFAREAMAIQRLPSP
nr:sugar phosphate isomerase/epimerase [Natronoglycomyces albus]